MKANSTAQVPRKSVPVKRRLARFQNHPPLETAEDVFRESGEERLHAVTLESKDGLRQFTGGFHDQFRCKYLWVCPNPIAFGVVGISRIAQSYLSAIIGLVPTD